MGWAPEAQLVAEETGMKKGFIHDNDRAYVQITLQDREDVPNCISTGSSRCSEVLLRTDPEDTGQLHD